MSWVLVSIVVAFMAGRQSKIKEAKLAWATLNDNVKIFTLAWELVESNTFDKEAITKARARLYAGASQALPCGCKVRWEKTDGQDKVQLTNPNKLEDEN